MDMAEPGMTWQGYDREGGLASFLYGPQLGP